MAIWESNREYTKSHNKCVTNSERTRGRGGGAWAEYFLKNLIHDLLMKQLSSQEPQRIWTLALAHQSKTTNNIVDVINTLKNRKTPGCDNLEAELFKALE